MEDVINLSDVYDKNLNFLIGSGASAGLFPTLALRIKSAEGYSYSLESLASLFEEKKDQRLDWLFAHYYSTCIRPAQSFSSADTDAKSEVLKNYEHYLETLQLILQKRKPLDKRCNVFTTNYDSCFSHAADSILSKGSKDFTLNDGARGFRTRHLQARNFNSYLCQTGAFERTLTSVPQINLIHLHGSIFWRRTEKGIQVDYSQGAGEDLIPEQIKPALNTFGEKLQDEKADLSQLLTPPMVPQYRDAFWTAYKKLPIVNPTKWKFHETVFEEHYYQMLRYLSYELEKPNAVLITFGFSFADEHILNLVQRSLANPTLQLFICCYCSKEFGKLSQTFRAYSNVKCIGLTDVLLDFAEFNRSVFSADVSSRQVGTEAPKQTSPSPEPTGAALPAEGGAP